MKRLPLLCTAAALAASLLTVQADSKEDVTAGAKKLSEKGYSWKSASEMPGGAGGGGGGGGRRGGFGGPQEGKVSADGLASVKVTFGETTTEALIKGEKFVVNRGEGWQTGEELAANADQGGGGRGRFAGAMFRNFKTPAARAIEVAGQTKELKATDGVIAGDLTEEGAKSLLMFGGRGGGGGPEISGAKGSVKFWVKDGVLSKMETKVQGTVSFNGNDREVDRTTTTEFKDVGTTTVTMPDEAKKKLS